MSEWHNIGRISPVPAGTWSSAKAYKRLDIVTDSNGEKSYIALKDVPAGTALSNTAYWQLIVDNASATINAVNRLTSPFSKNGDVVVCNPVEQHPLNAKSIVEPVQAGSGDPSPSNIRPISGHTGAKLTRCGKNLVSNTATTQTVNGVTFTVNADGSVVANGTNSLSSMFTVLVGRFNMLASTKYILSGSPASDAISLTLRDRYGNNTYASDGGWSPEFMVDKGDDTASLFIRVAPNATVDNLTLRPMIRLASETDAAYEPYQGDTVTVNFGQTVYGGTLDWNTGVLTVDRAVYNFTGNEPFSLASGGIPYFTVTKSAGVIASVVRFDQTSAENGSCSHYKPVSAWSGNACEYMGVTHSFRFTDTRFAAVDDFKAYLAAQKTAGTPVQVCYKLATPTTIQLTPQQVLGLKGVNTLYSDCGKSDVSGRIDPEWMNEQLKNAIIALGGNV